MFVATNFLPREPYTSFVATKICFAVFAVTKYFCHDKNILSRETQFCRDKSFVASSVLLSQQKTCFVATKMILVAAPASDKRGRLGGGGGGRRLYLTPHCHHQNDFCLKTGNDESHFIWIIGDGDPRRWGKRETT